MKLYVYDHCPYCVKARMIFGFKDIDYELITLLNDDEETPISMIGQKMVPILEREDGKHMPESMDIIHYIDENYGEKVLVGEGGNAALEQWMTSSRDYSKGLCTPRWPMADLEEFKTTGAIEYFTRKKEEYVGPFSVQLENTAVLKAKAEEHLLELVDIITSPEAVNDNLSEDDIHLFVALRSLSIVKGINYPDKVEQYRQYMAKTSKIPLHDDIAIL